MDLVENVPNDIARQITQLHEHNHRYHQLLAQLESTLDLVCNKTNNELRKRNSLLKIQRSLIEIQEIADEKLLLIQSILDQLDGKARQLDFDYRSVTYNSSSNVTNNTRVQMQTSLVTNNYSSGQRSEATNSSANCSNTNNLVNNTTTETVAKEVVNGNSNGLSNDNSNASTTHSGKRASARRNAPSRGNNDSNNDNSSKRSVKRGVKTSHKEMKRSRNSINSMNSNSNSSLLLGNTSPPAIYEGAPIDPDEPTYCLCDQVSYGEMICCDNSDCKIEWFHFSCVSLNTKPKGKWFCPNCRGDRSNIQKK